MYMDHSSWLI